MLPDYLLLPKLWNSLSRFKITLILNYLSMCVLNWMESAGTQRRSASVILGSSFFFFCLIDLCSNEFWSLYLTGHRKGRKIASWFASYIFKDLDQAGSGFTLNQVRNGSACT